MNFKKENFSLTCVEQWTGSDGHGIHAKLNHNQKFLFYVRDDGNGGGVWPETLGKEQHDLSHELNEWMNNQPKITSSRCEDFDYSLDFLVYELLK